jgi:hypothetical protein
MVTWKRLTEQNGSHVDVNLDNISHMRRESTEETTTLFFVSTTATAVCIAVKETPDQIHMAQSPRSFG